MDSRLKFGSIVFLLAVAGCTAGPGGTSPSGIANAINGVQRFCVAEGPDFSGTENLLRAAGARIEGSPGRTRSYRLPNGDFVNLYRGEGRPQCTYMHAGAAPLSTITGLMHSQPGIQPVPHGVERVDTGRGIVAFQNLWISPTHGVAISVAPGMIAYPGNTQFTGFAVEARSPSELRPSRNGQLPVISMR